MRNLSVWWEGAIVGTLQVNKHGQMRFAYAPEWLADASRSPISFSLPKQEQPFRQSQCRPFFAGLLPEESQRDLIAGALAPDELFNKWREAKGAGKTLSQTLVDE